MILAFLRLQADYAPRPSTVNRATRDRIKNVPNAAGRRHPGRQGLRHAFSKPTVAPAFL